MKFLRNVLMVFAVLQLTNFANAGWGSAAYYGNRNNGYGRGDNDAAKAYFATGAATTGLGTIGALGTAAAIDSEYRDERQYNEQGPRGYGYGYRGYGRGGYYR